MFRHLLVKSIHFYQQHLSPLKGFCCAYAEYHQEPSCSHQVIHIIKTQSVYKWPRLIRLQFQACRQALFSLQKEKQRRKKQKKDRDNWLDCCDPSCACDIVTIPKSCGKGFSKPDIDIGCCPFDGF